MATCDRCNKQTVRIRSNPNTDWDWVCDDCYTGETVEFKFPMREQSRANHWNEIKTRVKTHEGEFLSGRKGVEYQRKYSTKYLGRNLVAAPTDTRLVERFEKIGR